MAYQNIFSPKKKPQVAGSGYTSAYSNNPTNQGAFSKFGSDVVSGNGVSAVQSIFKPKLDFNKPKTTQQQQSTPQANMSKAPIRGSGMTSAYQVNPTNYKAPTATPPPAKTEAVVTPKPDAFNTRLADVMGRGKEQQQFAEDARRKQEDYIRQQYQLANQQLGEALPAAQGQFNQFKGNTEASIADLIAGGQRQKSQAEDYQGEAQRKAAQTLRETQGQTQRTFAGLGTLDSRGEGSFAQANENQMSEFNRFTQTGLKELANKKAEIDSTVGAAERSARAKITEEEAKLSGLARDIQYAMANNNLQMAKDLTDAYNETKQYIYDIEDSVSQMKYQFALEGEKLDNELAKIQSFTPEFMATGVPTNQAEYEFIVKNQKEAGQYYGTAPQGGKQTEKQMAYNAAGQIAQNALAKLNSGNISTGIGSKFGGSLGEKLGTNSPEQQAYRSDIAAMRTSVQNALLGANMAPQEMEQIMAAIPQFNDDINIARTKLQSLITNLPIMAGKGQEVSPQLDPAQLQQIIDSLGQ